MLASSSWRARTLNRCRSQMTLECGQPPLGRQSGSMKRGTKQVSEAVRLTTQSSSSFPWMKAVATRASHEWLVDLMRSSSHMFSAEKSSTSNMKTTSPSSGRQSSFSSRSAICTSSHLIRSMSKKLSCRVRTARSYPSCKVTISYSSSSRVSPNPQSFHRIPELYWT